MTAPWTPPSVHNVAMTLALGNITFDCSDPVRVGSFWSAALGCSLADDANEWFCRIVGTDGKPSWFFSQVPEPKSAKNRMHIDLHADDREVEVARLESLGASRVGEKDEWGVRWTVLQDPEGNEFCVSARHPD